MPIDFPHGGFVYASGWTTWRNITGPLNKQERSRITQHSKHSRPGPSYWKIAFLHLFPECAQEAYWDLIDTQRASGIIAAATRMAAQVKLDKPSGGVRPLNMLEKSFKAIEGPVARRKAEARSTWPNGTVYLPFILAGDVAKRAPPEVLYTDALVCDDAMKYNRQFCRSPTDYEKYYNVIQPASCEAVEECMGIQQKPPPLRRKHFPASP